MTVLIFLLAALCAGALIFFFQKMHSLPFLRPETEENILVFLSHFCRLRAEHEILGSAYISFTRQAGGFFSLEGEMSLFFSGSTVTIRESFGLCPVESLPGLTERLCQKLPRLHPGAEIDAGPRRICVR